MQAEGNEIRYARPAASYEPAARHGLALAAAVEPDEGGTAKTPA